MRILSRAEAKAKLGQVVAEVSQPDEEISSTRSGPAAAVVVSHEEFESWKETAAVLSDPQFRGQIRKGVKALRARSAKTFRGKDLDRLFRDVR